MGKSDTWPALVGFAVWAYIIYLAPQLIIYITLIAIFAFLVRKAHLQGTLGGNLKWGVYGALLFGVVGSFVGIAAFGTAVSGSGILGIVGFAFGFVFFSFYHS